MRTTYLKFAMLGMAEATVACCPPCHAPLSWTNVPLPWLARRPLAPSWRPRSPSRCSLWTTCVSPSAMR